MEYYLRAIENAKKTAQQLIVRNDVNEKNKFEEKSFMFKLLRLFTRNN